MQLSIIIPTYQEEACIADVVKHILTMETSCSFELIVTDGGSTDNTVFSAKEAGARVVVSPRKGRAAQMNFGAAESKGEILYFLHADAFPPQGFMQSIVAAVEAGNGFGHFRQHILSANPLVRINSFLSRLSGLAASGGDQSLFITRSLFEELGGFDERLPLMEDYDLVCKARKQASWVKFTAPLKVLDRKYKYNSFMRVNLVNAFIFSAYRLGVSPVRLKRWYKRWIRGPRYKNLS
jgi:rSAM/selenodomain-associated transferase 2